ncbi:excisionase [Butyrivibrio sp. AC2005]|uniref:excisionase n=1 Tax=Butyrivibrio sp. AC2005 TaxID=1280672 RepID=UPI0003F54E5D|nr:excisionase [Butyrivibrio sp. AC2005]
MSGCIWKFSQYLDEEDLMFARRYFITYKIGCEYYGLGEKPMIRMAWESGAVYKIGKRVLIRRDIFEEYLRDHMKLVEDLIEGDDEKLLKTIEGHVKEENEYE